MNDEQRAVGEMLRRAIDDTMFGHEMEVQMIGLAALTELVLRHWPVMMSMPPSATGRTLQMVLREKYTILITQIENSVAKRRRRGYAGPSPVQKRCLELAQTVLRQLEVGPQ